MPNAKAHIANLIADGFWYWKEDEYQFVMAFTLSSDENANSFTDDFKSFVENQYEIELPPILAGELSSAEHKIHIKNIGNTLLFADGVKSDDVKQIFDSFSTPRVQRIPKFMSKPSKYPLPEILAPYVKHH
jgi:aspartyl aminopeptidase